MKKNYHHPGIEGIRVEHMGIEGVRVDHPGIPGVRVENDYPNSPGFKVEGTSEWAAMKIGHTRAGSLKVKVYLWLLENQGTADEVAKGLDENPFSVRPRVTELKNLGFVVPTGEVRQNNDWSGMDAMIWKAVS